MMIENKDKKVEVKQDKRMWSAYELALNLGWMIVIPVVVFGIGGAILDKKIDTFPIFTVVGFIISITSSLLIIYSKTKDIILTGKPKQK